MEMQQCESCGREFACGATTTSSHQQPSRDLAPRQLAVLREHFLTCLCPDCLRVAAETSA